ncbi:hypothetical protein BV20DRAFT_1122184 [Pilatotrama ljubarskyi]|nr:hypothetical protein BV20DRAFT_1122184 [Pilatotrama ljubarskyi]
MELLAAVMALKSLVNKSRGDQALNEDEEEEANIEQLENVLEMLQTRIDAPQMMNVSFSAFLKLKSDVSSHLAEADPLVADGPWSADVLYRHLQFLQGFVPCTNEAAARMWINAFFYRMACMVPSGSGKVLSVEQGFTAVTPSDPSLHIVSGSIAWTAILTSPAKADRFVHKKVRLADLQTDNSALLVSVEAKGPDLVLAEYVPQAICEMHACARTVLKSTIRGVLTDGHTWIFLILTLNGSGGTYFQSPEIHVYRHAPLRQKDSTSRQSPSSL